MKLSVTFCLLGIVIFLMIVISCGRTVAPSVQSPEVLWAKTYGGIEGDYSYSAEPTSDFGFIIVGSTESFGAGDRDVYLIKVDSIGDTIWTKTYGGASGDFGESVQQTSDEGYIITGYTYSFGAGASDIYLIKTDANGIPLWTRTFGGSEHEISFSVQQTYDGGYIVAGYTGSFGAGEYDVWLIKTSASGDTIWTKTYGGTGWDQGFSVQQTSDGGYIVAGTSSADVYLIKTDSIGGTLWTKTYGRTKSGEYGYSVQETQDGGYIVAGTVQKGVVENTEDVYLIKVDSIGDTIWTKTYGGASGDFGESVQQTSDEGYIIGGYTGSLSVEDIYLIKIDASGNTIWTKTYGGTGCDQAFSVQQTFDGGYIVAGRTNSFGAGKYDVYLIKLK